MEYSFKSQGTYIELIATIEKIANIFDVILLNVVFVNSIFPLFIVSFGVYYIYDKGDESFYLPFPVLCVHFIATLLHQYLEKKKLFIIQTLAAPPFNNRLPFSWKNPIGYLLAWLAQVAAARSSMVLLNLVLSFLFGNCYLIIGILKELENDFEHFNGIEPSNADYNEMKMHFCQIIRCYTDVRQLSCLTTIPKKIEMANN